MSADFDDGKNGDGTEATSWPETMPGRFTRQHVDAILAAYPRRIGIEAGRRLVEYALVEIARGDSPPADPAAWLLERVQRFARSYMGGRGEKTCVIKTWFDEKRWQDDPAHWEKTTKGEDGPRGAEDVVAAHHAHRKGGAAIDPLAVVAASERATKAAEVKHARH